MRSYDLCVIGGGLLGTSTAYFGARAGLKVVLIEQHDLASGASGAAFGGVSVGIYSYSSVRVPRGYVELSKASLELYHRLQNELGPPLDLHVPGSLDPFYSEAGLERGRARANGLQECGVPCKLLTRREVQEIEPAISDAIAGATYCPVDAHVTPLCVVWALTKGARLLGAEFLPRTRALSILVEGGRAVGVQIPDGKIAAGWVVNTAGIGAGSLAATADITIPIDCSRGQMFVTERIPPLLRTYIHNIKQTASGTIVIGATRENGTTDTGVTVPGTKEVLGWALRLLPALADVRVVRAWAGIRPVPPDGYPIIGPVDGLERMLVAIMHRGVTLAPVIGEILVDLILKGRSRFDIGPYLLSRFASVPASEFGEAQETFYAG